MRLSRQRFQRLKGKRDNGVDIYLYMILFAAVLISPIVRMPSTISHVNDRGYLSVKYRVK